jgi:hypothetical protein
MGMDRGPWNALIDDDGSGLVGSIWNKAQIKSVILDPADAAFAAVLGNWTPVDASGAGLTFAINGGTPRYWKIDKFVAVVASLNYPVTASNLGAKIGGLPFTNGPVVGALYPIWIQTELYYLLPGTQEFLVNNATTGSGRTNAEMSGKTVSVGGFYLVA